MKRLKKLLEVLGPCLLLASMACSASPGAGAYKIAIVPARSGQHGIFVMNSDNTGSKLLTADANAQLRPSSWSPDGKRIAFLSFRPGDTEALHKPRILQ
jgi:Tol biopolymer transport system component